MGGRAVADQQHRADPDLEGCSRRARHRRDCGRIHQPRRCRLLTTDGTRRGGPHQRVRDRGAGRVGRAPRKIVVQKFKDQIADQVIGIDAQQDALARQLELIEEELVNKEGLRAQGLVRAPEILALQREEARLAGSVGELKASKAQAEGRITEIDIQILSLQTKRREEAITTLRDLQFRERELAEKRLAIRERLNRLDITAPVGGVIYGLTVFAPRSVIRPADPVLFIVPQDRPLVIAAQVEPIHIDKLFVDQEVSLRFSSLDQRQTPELFGRVVQISADAFEDQNSRVRYYRAEIVLNEGEIDRLPEGAALIPGMPVEAFIRTEDRTPLAYLVKPFTDYFAKAFRES